jgi:hypothetical protein
MRGISVVWRSLAVVAVLLLGGPVGLSDEFMEPPQARIGNPPGVVAQGRLSLPPGIAAQGRIGIPPGAPAEDEEQGRIGWPPGGPAEAEAQGRISIGPGAPAAEAQSLWSRLMTWFLGFV